MEESNLWYAKYLAVSVVLGTTTALLKRFFSGGVCKSVRMLTGKTVIVTGANTGIGKETAMDLAKRKARVILACRDTIKAKKAAEEITREAVKANVEANILVKHLDLASLASINKFCDEILSTEHQIDVLINNAGVFQCPYMLTEDGFEMQMGVNHLGHFLLTNRLLPLLQKACPSRVLILTSALHKRGKIKLDDLNSKKRYSKRAAYSNSKLANVLFAKELHKRFHSRGINVCCIHPGIVRTELGRHIKVSPLMNMIVSPLMWLFFKSPWYGAQTSIYCAIAGELEGQSGGYYGDCKEEPFPCVENAAEEMQEKLWTLSEKLTGLYVP